VYVQVVLRINENNANKLININNDIRFISFNIGYKNTDIEK